MAVHEEIIFFQDENLTVLMGLVNDWLHDIAVLDVVSVQFEIFPVYTVMITYKHNE